MNGKGDRRAQRAALLAGAGILVLGALIVFLWQVEVGSGGVSRSCGSAFDAAVDRSGWQSWWAGDLDDSAAGGELIRTERCPPAVNRRIVLSVALATAALLLGVVSVRTARPERTAAGPPPALERIGTVTAAVGIALTLGGIIAIVVLVADADSTLFLYTDRLVVAVVGLITLVPALALALAGWALRTVGRDATRPDADGG